MKNLPKSVDTFNIIINICVVLNKTDLLYLYSIVPKPFFAIYTPQKMRIIKSVNNNKEK